MLRSLKWGLLIIPIPSNTRQLVGVGSKSLTQNVKGICYKHMNLILFIEQLSDQRKEYDGLAILHTARS